MIQKQWFLCTIKTGKMVEGKEIPQKVAEKYLFDAMTYIEAEARCIHELSAFSRGVVEITDIVKKRYEKVVLSDDGADDKFYEVKYSLVTLDERSLSEKKSKCKMLIQAESLKNAYEEYEEQTKGSMGDHELNAIVEVPIIDVYPYVAPEEENKTEESNNNE